MDNPLVSMSIFAAAVFCFLGPPSLARAADDWTAPVANVVDGKQVPATYTPIPVSQVTKPWKICVLFPHMKDFIGSRPTMGSLSRLNVII